MPAFRLGAWSSLMFPCHQATTTSQPIEPTRFALHRKHCAMNDLPSDDNRYDDLGRHAAEQADAAIASTREASNAALDALQKKADHLATVAPGTLRRVADQVDELTRRGMEMAKNATDSARAQALQANDRALGYVRQEPAKAVLIAAAVGAGLAMLIGMLARDSRSTQR